MGKEKGGFLSPKAIANRIKAKGLQKLRWYCEMCQKQCRDENGFKCHLTSESHQRQLLLFAENPEEYIDSFSEEFFSNFTELLSRRFGTKRVQANIVYQEYISDKEHVHMNSTKWETLTDFVKWLGREGHCIVDQTEKGWYITHIDRDPATIERQKALETKERMEMDDEERTMKMIEKQIERARAEGKEAPVHEATELKRENEEEKVVLGLNLVAKKDKTTPLQKANPLKALPAKEESIPSTSSEPNPQKRKASALDDIMQMEKAKKEKMENAQKERMQNAKKEKVTRKDYWLTEGIVVKIITKKVGEALYKKKALVREVVGRYAAIVKVLDTGDKIKVDQAHLETVIPALGKQIMVVNGEYRGTEAVLDELDQKHFSCRITLKKGPLKGRVVNGLPYEDISKLHVPDK